MNGILHDIMLSTILRKTFRKLKEELTCVSSSFLYFNYLLSISLSSLHF